MQDGVPGRIQSIVNIHNPSIEVHRVPSRDQHRRGGHPGAGRRAQHAERRHRRARTSSPFFYNYGVTTVILQKPAAPRRLQPADRRGLRRAAGDPDGARAREGVEHRSAQDRHHGILGRRRARRAGGDLASTRSISANKSAGRSAGRRQLAARFRRARLSGADAVRPRSEHCRSRATRRQRSSPAPAPAMPFTPIWADEYLRGDAEGAASRTSRCTSTATACTGTG